MSNEPSKPGSETPLVPGTAAQTTASNLPAMGRPVTTVTAGTLIMGTYEIEKLINSGGMGEVYRGRNIHNGEPVAIKIVLPSLAHDPKIVALFQKESTTLSRLSHEAIVRYHVFTVDPTIGRPCLVMEFVSGLALSDRIEQGPMPLAEMKTMLHRVASGLDKAHRAGVVHRDLSPDNVILEGGSVEHAKLIDFGIAKSTAIGAGTLLQGQFAGKFNWVSPEQLGAFGGDVDGRSDIYSLALVTAAASRGAVLPMGASIVDAVGKRASVPDLAGVAPELVPLLTWMLQPDPAQRVESMARVMAAVDNPSLVPMPTPAAPPVPDPNRTVVGGVLPQQETPPPAASWPAPVDNPPPSPPPLGATVISSTPPRSLGAPPALMDDADDVSPFGVPTAGSLPGPAKPVSALPEAKKSKGGVLAMVTVLALAGAGAGAYYAGLLGPKSNEPTPPTAEANAEMAKQAADEAAAKQVADDAAAKQVAEDAAAKQAADEAAAKQAADEAAAKQAAEEAAAKQAADVAAAQKAAEDAAKKAADAAAAKQAAEDAAKADPVARQNSFLAGFIAPECVYIHLLAAKPEGFVLDGFANAPLPLKALAKEWRAQTEAKPDVVAKLVNQEQCPVLDFMNHHVTAGAQVVNVILSKQDEVVKSGGTVSGTVEGLQGRFLTLFLVSGGGGATNLQPLVVMGADGSASFSLTVSLAKDAPPAPQLLLALATSERIARLDEVPNGVTAKSLIPFIESQTAVSDSELDTGLGYFRLEN